MQNKPNLVRLRQIPKCFNLSNNNDYELLPAIRVAGRTIQNKPNQTQPVGLSNPPMVSEVEPISGQQTRFPLPKYRLSLIIIEGRFI